MTKDSTPELPSIIAAFRQQAGYCTWLGAPVVGALLEGAADDLSSGGQMQKIIPSWPGDPVADALALRFAGAIHNLVLCGQANDVATFYPSVGGGGEGGDIKQIWPKVAALIQKEKVQIKKFMTHPPQTNEVRRSSALLGGFLKIAHQTGHPFHLYEIGASAGLNLLWDQYFYQAKDNLFSWGNPESPVKISFEWSGAPPRVDAKVDVAQRAACDVKPIDLAQKEQRQKLEAYVWADQTERLTLLRAACAMALDLNVKVEKAQAAHWVEHILSQKAPQNIVRVIYHSVMWQYLSQEERAQIKTSLMQAGAAATPATPLAWLRLEPDIQASGAHIQKLYLTLWDGTKEAQTELLGYAHPHGASMDWEGN